MKRYLRIVIGSLLLIGAYATQAQTLDKEKTIDVSKKAARGTLGHVETNDASREISLVYVTKSTNKKIKFETYLFDYDLNLLNSMEEEVEVDKARSKFSWFKFKGEEYVVEGISAEPNMMGTFVIKKKRITYNWSWFTLSYRKNTKLLDKLKFEGENGKNMFYLSHYENDATGEIIAMAGEKGKAGDMIKHYTVYHFFKVDYSLNVLSDVKVDMGSPNMVIYSAPTIDNQNPTAESPDWVVVTAPAGGNGVGKAANPIANELTIFRISPEGKIKSQTKVKSKVHSWHISGSYIDGDKVYIYGSGFAKDVEKKYWGLYDVKNFEQKFTDFQLIRLGSNSVDFVSANAVTVFTEKNRKPDDQKNPSIYNGKKVDIRDLTVLPSGDIFITAQNYKTDGQGNVQGTIFTEMYLFHFTAQGELKNCFAIDDDSRKGALIGGSVADARFYPTNSVIIGSKDPSVAYWVQLIPHHTACVTEQSGTMEITTCTPVYYPRMIKLDIATGKFTKIENYGNGEYFLRGDKPYITIENRSKIIFLGENKSGKSLWLGKLDPANL
ncbi:MAG: hypothetical protein MUE33_03715 [Cytophagaceae bacterium]|jgi:hypothetical protein|nr:hypothetical protein [Cytophagaceae bacterium]